MNSYTLVRFFALHYLIPFVILFLVVLHVFFLHSTGRSNPLGVSSSSYKLPFHYYHSVGDLFGFVWFLGVFIVFCLVFGYYFIDAENFIPANPLQTPAHIQPEWYFLFAYAILRSIPNKLGGVVALVVSIAFMFLFSLLPGGLSLVGGVVYSPVSKVLFWSFFGVFLVLT